MQIINPGPEDYHIHSINYSDGLMTIEEIVQYAGKTYRSLIRRWKNVHNEVQVSFGIEGDLLNEDGEICDHIQGKKSDFLILSAHKSVYQSNPNTINQAYLKALERHHTKIAFLGHPCIRDFADYLDIEALTKNANQYNIPLEVNGANLLNNKTNKDNLRRMLTLADIIYVNSDAHVLCELKTAREGAFKFLKEEGF